MNITLLNRRMKRTVTLLMMIVLTAFGFASLGSSQQAWADTLTPEASSYNVDKTSEEIKLNAKEAGNQVEKTAAKTQNALEEATESIKEKLNLDEPIPADTKKFFKQIQGKEPIVNERIPQLNQ